MMMIPKIILSMFANLEQIRWRDSDLLTFVPVKGGSVSALV